MARSERTDILYQTDRRGSLIKTDIDSGDWEHINRETGRELCRITGVPSCQGGNEQTEKLHLLLISPPPPPPPPPSPLTELHYR